MGYLKHLDIYTQHTDTLSRKPWHLCAGGAWRSAVQRACRWHSKDNYILFPSIKLNCPNNGMACSQQHCCVLLQTIIELTVHFFTGGWNIKFDQILVLMLLHFASLPVFLDDRRICDHSTMTEDCSCGRRLPWSWLQQLVLQKIMQFRSGKTGQKDRSQTHKWQNTLLPKPGCCETMKSVKMLWSVMLLLQFLKLLFPLIFVWISIWTGGKRCTDTEHYSVSLL